MYSRATSTEPRIYPEHSARVSRQQKQRNTKNTHHPVFMRAIVRVPTTHTHTDAYICCACMLTAHMHMLLHRVGDHTWPGCSRRGNLHDSVRAGNSRETHSRRSCRDDVARRVLCKRAPFSRRRFTSLAPFASLFPPSIKSYASRSYYPRLQPNADVCE